MTHGPFLIYSLHGCPFCESARRLLRRLGLEYRSKYPEREELRRIVGAGPRANVTYPQIFLGERHIGGFDDLAKFLGVARQRGVSVKQACGGGGGGARGC